MTRIAVPSGVPLTLAPFRLADRSWALGAATGDNVDTSTSQRVAVTATASATPQTKGAWAQAIATTAYPTNLIDVVLTVGTFTNAANTAALLDIGIGGAGSETVLVSNLNVGFRNVGAMHYCIPVPELPVGTRVAVRCQGQQVSKTVTVSLEFRRVPGYRTSAVVTYGDDTTASRGTLLAVPGAVNTKGAWTQFAAATTSPLVALAVGMGISTNAAADANLLIDVGVGSAGNETVVIGDISAKTTSLELVFGQEQFFPATIPTGSRLALRYARSAAMSPYPILYGVAA